MRTGFEYVFLGARLTGFFTVILLLHYSTQRFCGSPRTCGVSVSQTKYSPPLRGYWPQSLRTCGAPSRMHERKCAATAYPPGFSHSSFDEVRGPNISSNVARDELRTSMAEHRTRTKEVMESLQNSYSDDFWPPKFVRTIDERDKSLTLSEVHWTG